MNREYKTVRADVRSGEPPDVDWHATWQPFGHMTVCGKHNLLTSRQYRPATRPVSCPACAAELARHEQIELDAVAKTRAVLEPFVGKTLASFHQEPYSGGRYDGDWADDEPLELTFTDGSVLRLTAGGWHESGSLSIEAVTPA